MIKRLILPAAILGAMVLLLVPEVPAYQGGPVANGGSITGVVKFTGKPPASRKVKVTKDKKVCGAQQVVERVKVNKTNSGLKFVVVSLVDIKKGKAMASATASLDQRGCVFNPYVVLLDAGGSLGILNSDKILHNIHTYSRRNPSLNIAHPKFKKKITKKFTKPEIVKITCDVHKWMEGWLVVMDHPYYVVTDDNGAFKLSDVPAGTYKLQVWHPALGKQTRQITVKPKQAVKVNFKLKARK
ncbi:MAG: carboxypeptidase regulatory-like domain-containing protein [Thermodesulfobacteriota bacterium]